MLTVPLVYFFRWIIHNYSTPYAVKLLKNLVPALKPGARVIINDHCLREPGSENPWDEKLMRGMDMIMLTLLNAQEREEREFKELFKAADEGFVFKARKKKNCQFFLKITQLTIATGGYKKSSLQDEHSGSRLGPKTQGEWSSKGGRVTHQCARVVLDY